MNKPQSLENIDSIDLDAHCVIEASAGTGKTYTLENIVIKLLTHNKVKTLDEIIIVTFTEKATSELKTRIRQKIENELAETPNASLKESLANFDTASIYTIHGFCNKIIQQYAFENGEQFNYELADDQIIYTQLLHDQMRESWQKRYNNSLNDILNISLYPSFNAASGTSSWEDLVISVAQKYNTGTGDRLNPEINSGLINEINLAESNLAVYCEELLALIGCIDMDTIENSPFFKKYKSLSIQYQPEKKYYLLQSVLWLLGTHSQKKIRIRDYIEFFQKVSINSKHGFEILMLEKTKKIADYQTLIPELDEIISLLEKIRTFDYARLQNLLASESIMFLKKDAYLNKLKHGLMSYDDMIQMVFSALNLPGSTLQQALQKKYRYALVDEFQDTDLMQWTIFKKIFLDNSKTRLIIIGDPKQAIYGFRGADIYAYFTAKKTMIEKYHAHNYTLNRNWRSTPSLIHIFNRIFGSNGWFPENEIEYFDSVYPPEKEITLQHAYTEQDFILVDLGEISGGKARIKMAEFTAQEIHNIIHDPHNDINLSDIAILIRNWNEARPIEQALRDYNILFTYYKKEGIYQSREAIHLKYLLQAIAKPSEISYIKKAILTEFFSFSITDLENFESSAMSQEMVQMFEMWKNISIKRNWSQFFQSVIEDSRIFFRLREDEDFELKRTNYLHIIQELAMYAYSGNKTLADIINHLALLINNMIPGNAQFNFHKISSDEPKVQLLTIHASKGLQFKIVFLVGGFTKRKPPSYFTYHSKGSKIFDLLKDPQSKMLHHIEEDNEEARLFYVALTRAKERLYVPKFTPTKRSASKAGIVGSKLATILETIQGDPIVKKVIFSEQNIIPQKNTIQKKSAFSKTPSVARFLIKDAFNFLDRRLIVESYTTIKNAKRINHHQSMQIVDGDRKIHLFDEVMESISADNEIIDLDITILPRGKELGIILHQILEKIPFSELSGTNNYKDLLMENSSCYSIISEKIHNLAGIFQQLNIPECMNEIAKIIWNSLMTRIDSDTLRLCEIHNKVHEIEFHYALSTHGETKKIYLNGFIDLLFEYNKKYYILDWKSNFIKEGYAQGHLHKNIIDSEYDLQYKIYALAVVRWLKRIIPDFSYDIHFGGIYYLYLRGIDATDPSKGIYFFKPENESILEKYEGELFQIIL